MKLIPLVLMLSASVFMGVAQAKKAPSLLDIKDTPYQHDASGTQVERDVYDDTGEKDAIFITDNLLTYIAGTPVVTSPYIGKRSAFNAADLIVNIPSVHLPLRILEQRAKLEDKFIEQSLSLPKHTIIELSGKVTALAKVEKPYTTRTTGDVDLNGVKLITVAKLTPWVTGYTAMDYDNSPPAISGNRMRNANIFLDKSFITIGNLNNFPLFVTAGQATVPFGRYSSFMLSQTLTGSIGSTKARMLELGFKQDDYFGAIYGFNGDTGTEHSGTYGANIGYRLNGQKIIGELSASVISNLSESEGLQDRFGATKASEATVKRIPAAAVQASFGFGNFSVIGEFVSAIATYNPLDLSHNGSGAQPRAVNAEMGYRFDVFNKPSLFAIGYGWSDDALAIGLPKHRISGVFNTSIWRDTIQTLEIRHDINYGAGTTAGGRTDTGFAPITATQTSALGRSTTTVSAQIGYYF